MQWVSHSHKYLEQTHTHTHTHTHTSIIMFRLQLVIIPEALENDPFRFCTARLSEASLKTSKQKQLE